MRLTPEQIESAQPMWDEPVRAGAGWTFEGAIEAHVGAIGYWLSLDSTPASPEDIRDQLAVRQPAVAEHLRRYGVSGPQGPA